MHNRRDEVADENIITLAQRYVAAYNDMARAIKEHGPLSKEAANAHRMAVLAQTRFRNKRAYENQRRKA